MLIPNKFEIGDTVYLKTDSEQLPRIVTGFMVRSKDHIVYELCSGEKRSDHYYYELSMEKDVLISCI